jgi:hypothetical protein
LSASPRSLTFAFLLFSGRLPIVNQPATRHQLRLGTLALGSLQAFAWDVSPRGDHRMGSLGDHAERLGPGPSIRSWMLAMGTSSGLQKVA